MSVRAKFKVDSITRTKQYDGQEAQTIRLTPVVDGSEENKQFYKYTPGGSIDLSTVNADAGNQFELGAQFYVDFTKAE